MRAKTRILKLERKRILPARQVKYRWGDGNNDYLKNDLSEAQQAGFVVVRWSAQPPALLLG